jgi:hypothetical protein
MYEEVKSKAIPVTGRGGLNGRETSRIPHFVDNLFRWRLGCQLYAPDVLYSPGRFLVLISVRG